jgi:hypothetical protein
LRQRVAENRVEVNGSGEMGKCLDSEQRAVYELGNQILYQGEEGDQLSGSALAIVKNEEEVWGFVGSG